MKDSGRFTPMKADEFVINYLWPNGIYKELNDWIQEGLKREEILTKKLAIQDFLVKNKEQNEEVHIPSIVKYNRRKKRFEGLLNQDFANGSYIIVKCKGEIYACMPPINKDDVLGQMIANAIYLADYTSFEPVYEEEVDTTKKQSKGYTRTRKKEDKSTVGHAHSLPKRK